MMMNFNRNNIWLVCFRSILVFVLLFSVLSFPDPSFASLAHDLIGREGWRKISLDFEGASLINILKIFSQQSGLNFIAAQNISGRTITLYLEDVPLREALDKILFSNKLTYELDEGSNIFIVKELIGPEVETITKVYNLKYARVRNSPLNLAASGSSTSGSSTSGGTTSAITRMIHTGLVDAVEAVLSSYGGLTEDSRTNSLIVTDAPYAFEVIDETIRRLDVPIPQVIIEVEIIDTSKSLVDTIGFNWTSVGSLVSYTLPQTSFDQYARGVVAIGGVGASLTHLMTSTDTKILARPKILTLSNETAEIKIIGDNVIGTISNFDETGSLESVTAERQEIGVNLRVTPSVNIKTGEITMVLEPRVSSITASAFTDENGNTFQNPQERSANVTVTVKNNQTIILGGMLRTDFNEAVTKVPFLGDIPFLGALFRYRNKSEDIDREMLVFITPRIVEPGGVNFVQLGKSSYNEEILAQREQSDYTYRKEEIDRDLGIWDNR